jgi:DnaJ-class molecular chaperone
MTFAEALACSAELGVNVETMGQKDFSISYFALAKRYHPDRNLERRESDRASRNGTNRWF